jgi:hypothetical protein
MGPTLRYPAVPGGKIAVTSTVIVTGTRRIALNAATKAGDVSCIAVTVNAKGETRKHGNMHERECNEPRTCSEEVWLAAASCAAVSKNTYSIRHAHQRERLETN